MGYIATSLPSLFFAGKADGDDDGLAGPDDVTRRRQRQSRVSYELTHSPTGWAV